MATELDTDSFTEAIESGETWVVDFWASWCGPCKQMAPIVEEVAEELDEVNIGKVNIEDHQELATQNGIRSIPSFVVFKDGERVDMKMGAMPKEEFKSWVQAQA